MNTNNQPEKLVLYSRLSRQKVNGGGQYGFDSQAFEFENYLSSLDSYDVVGEYGEFFTGTGDFRKRPEFMKALAKCKQEGATLVVTKIDRLSRSVESGSHLINNYNIVVTSQPEADTMMLHILLTVAQNEADVVSKRTKAALASAKRKGVLLGAANPLWQEKNHAKVKSMNKRKNTKAREHAEKYRKEIELMHSLGMKLYPMAQKLTEMGLYTPTGAKYTATGVSNLFKYLEIER